jgi:membrane protein implicated in regulation of membrane protease activity
MTPSILWLIAGIALCGAEALIGPGVGIVVAGLAAMCVGLILEMGLAAMDAYAVQAAWFFGLTVVWALVLWKPIRRLRVGRGSQHYSNIVGEIGEVGAEGLRAGMHGEVRWSGTLMRAELAAGAQVEEIPAGAQVVIVEVKGATLIVRPKERR